MMTIIIELMIQQQPQQKAKKVDQYGIPISSSEEESDSDGISYLYKDIIYIYV